MILLLLLLGHYLINIDNVGLEGLIDIIGIISHRLGNLAAYSLLD